MSKFKTKDQLKEMAKGYFDAYPKEETFIATGDGQFFTEANKSIAKSHARTIGSEITEISRSGKQESGDQGSGNSLLDVLSNVSGLSKEELKKTAKEVFDKKKASEANGSNTPPPSAPPQGEDKTEQSDADKADDLNEAKVGEADGIKKEGIEAKADGSVNELKADDLDAKKEDSNDVKTEVEQPVWAWTMEKMADWLNLKNVDFDLKDDKKTLWGKVKAELGKTTSK